MAGLLTYSSPDQLAARDQAEADAKAAADRQAMPVILGLAGYLRTCWDAAREAKQPIETKMLRALRQRTGEYEADKLAEIRKTGGSEIFMMVTETKCRGAESWLRDILLDEGEVPFGLKPTPIPDVPPDYKEMVTQEIANKVIQNIQQMGVAPDQATMKEYQEHAEEMVRNELLEEAMDRAERMQTFIRDQFAEGGMLESFDAFISDLTTYPNAILKGPVVRRQRSLDWSNETGKYVPTVNEKLAPTYGRVDPFKFYTEPGITKMEDGFTLEHHILTRSDLADLIGVPGYDDGAIRAVLDSMPTGALNGWLWSSEMTKAPLENKHSIWRRPTQQVDALEFWGRVSGKMLIEWGMDKAEVPDENKEYDVNAWLVGSHVIKATLNYDPLGGKPYKSTSFIKRPGSFWGTSIPEIIEDVQSMCNGAARALMNNMGLASGPQVEVNIDRLPEDEKVTQVYPWKIWQVLNDPLGSGQPAVRFNQPDDRSGALMTVYKEFVRLADDQSGIPAYVYGDGNVGGAGRTASGLSMLMGSAGKGIRQVIMHIDFEVIGPMVTDQYNWNMRYVDDETIKGDCEIIPRGAVTLATREQLNVRRVEFLQATANPIDSQIVGMKGRAAILREVAKGLSMPVDDIVPTDAELEIQEAEKKAAEAAQQQQQMAMQQQANGPRQVVVSKGEPTQTQPGGEPKGGPDANTASNQFTGAGA